MLTKKPKDLALAEVAYNAFYAETPQVLFDDLAPQYQMRWVRAIRSAMADYRKLKPPPNGGGKLVRTKVVAKAKPSDKATKANGVDPARLELWASQDKEDLSRFTDRTWSNKSREEVKARQRLAYRNKQRERYGLEQTQSASV